uniref:Uncharacterized protein n=1 Tax=Physcomitrium patens TaxID=3218 RepID=A0A2K1KEY9_PHYPA|nr:hypothetical protein PHYPA_008717 [Physcomitrium patens]
MPFSSTQRPRVVHHRIRLPIVIVKGPLRSSSKEAGEAIWCSPRRKDLLFTQGPFSPFYLCFRFALILRSLMPL